MRPLTHREWEQHYVELRRHVAEEWPQVDQRALEHVGDDFDGLVELLQRTTGESADLVRQRLKKLDVDELGIGSGQDRAAEPADGSASLAQLRLGSGFSEDERERVVARLEKLNRRLKKFRAEGTELEITVKDRDTPSQKVTLEAWLPKFPHLVATSAESDLMAALAEVREDLWHQIDDAVRRRQEATR